MDSITANSALEYVSKLVVGYSRKLRNISAGCTKASMTYKGSGPNAPAKEYHG